MMVESLRIAVGSTRHLPCDRIIELDPRHPITQGGFQLDVTVDDGIVVSAEPRIGFLHRSAEKLFESRDYRQIMMLANRHDWFSSFHGEWVIARAVEEALGLTPPERAVMSRVLLAEVQRINVCLLFLGCAVHPDRRDRTLLKREQLLLWYQSVAGSRIHPMINRIGGLAHPVDSTSLDELARHLDGIEHHVTSLAADVDAATEGNGRLGAIPRQTAQAYGLSGPVARASGLLADVRTTDSSYAPYRIEPTPNVDGTLRARYDALLHDIGVSIGIIRHAHGQLRERADEPINVPLPKVVRVPEGLSYTWVEGPLGRTGALVVSRGDKMPWRLKLVTPSFHTMQALPTVLVGAPLDELGPVLASTFQVIGDVDR